MMKIFALSPKRKIILLFLVIYGFFLPLSLLRGQERIVFSGVAESAGGVVIDTDESWHVAAEQYANFRITVPVGNAGKLYTAFNVLAASAPELGLVTEGELERLYASFRFDTTDVSLGFMRIPFGYGMGIRPTDIINPQNPLFPDARLRGVLATLMKWYPRDEIQIQGFAVRRSDEYFEGQSISSRGESLFGFSIDHHNQLLSVQGLAFTTISGERSVDHLLQFGVSLKSDMIVGLAFDALITTDGKTGFDEGRENAAIATAFGCDYSFIDGKLFLLAQYYYTSKGLLSSTDSIAELMEGNGMLGSGSFSMQAFHNGGMTFLRRHYGFLTILYNHSDYARLQLSLLSSFGDASVFPTIRHEFEPIQAVTLVSTLVVSLDTTVFGGEENGEFGPIVTGFYAATSFSVKYRF